MYDQLNLCFDKILSKCGFRKEFSTEYCLITMIEKLPKNIDNGGASANYLIDLSKGFDCLPPDITIIKEIDIYFFTLLYKFLSFFGWH